VVLGVWMAAPAGDPSPKEGCTVADDETSTLAILIVEDDEAVAEFLRALCNEVPGWGATVVPHAAAAQAVFDQVRIDLLVLDLNLPGISGLTLLELLRQRPDWHHPPVIVVTAVFDQPEFETAIRRAEVTAVVRKPFDVDDVLAAIESAAAAS
jgi:DNA-binding response OmpR family regulator